MRTESFACSLGLASAVVLGFSPIWREAAGLGIKIRSPFRPESSGEEASAELGYGVLSPFRSRSPVGYLSYKQIVAQYQAPKPLRAEPDYKGREPLYIGARLGKGDDNLYVMALARSRDGIASPDLLYVDRDNDGDLREETPIRALRYDRRNVFGPAHVLLDCGAYRSIYHFKLRQRNYSVRRYYLHSCCYHVGTLRIGDKECKVAVADYTGNGTYDDVATLPRKGDKLFVDLNGDGKWKGSTECHDLGKYTRLTDEYYAFKVSWDGSTISVAKPNVPCGMLMLSHGAASIWLSSDNGLFRFTLNGGESMNVPAGRYLLSGLRLTEKDENGDTWSIAAGTDEDKMTPCIVREGLASLMKIGPPLQVKVTPETHFDRVEFRLTVEGQAGERYYSYTKNKQRPPEPSFTVADASGKTLCRASLEYG